MVLSSCTRLSLSSCSKPLREIFQLSRVQSRTSSSSHRYPFYRSASQSSSHQLAYWQIPHTISIRTLHSKPSLSTSRPPRSRDRGPTSKESTQTDFASLDVLGKMPPPTTAIEACHS